jgi:hypothetical protein
LTADSGINVPQHRVEPERAHTSAEYFFDSRLQTGLHHGFSSVAVRRADALAKAVIERIIQIEDDAADKGLRVARLPLFCWRLFV